MMIRLSKLLSFEQARERRRKGQIATFLLLIIVAVLILSLATANLGQLSLTATTVANAADSAGLVLGSQLASQGNFLNETLKTAMKTYEASPTPKACKRQGFVRSVLSVLFSIAATWFLPGIGSWLAGLLLSKAAALAMTKLTISIIGAMIAGAIGGAIGGVIDTGSLKGAFLGAVHGAATGFGVAAGPGGLAKLVGGPLAKGGGTIVASLHGVPVAITMPVTATTAGTIAGVGSAAGGSMLGAPAIPGTIAGERAADDAMGAAAKSLSGLADPDRIRESAFFQALSQTIDDPTRVQDTIDSDRDGDTAEKVPAFQVLWDQRTKAIKQKLDQRADTVSGAIDGFLNGPAQTFGGQAAKFLGELSRKEVEGADGRVVELVRELEDAGTAPSGKPKFDPKFWQPGPTGAELKAWAECEDCKTPPEGYDELDHVIEELRDYLIGGAPETPSLIETLRGADAGARLALRDSWVKWLYDPDSGQDSYDTLRVIADGNPDEGVLGLSGWSGNLKELRDTLPACSLDDAAGGVSIRQVSGNPRIPPCQIHATRRADLQHAVGQVQSFLDFIRSGGWEQAVAEEWTQKLSAQGYTNPQVTAVTMTAIGLEPSADRGVIGYDYDVAFTYLDATQDPPKTKSETKTGNEGEVEIVGPGGPGLRIDETSTLSTFEAGVDDFRGFLNSIQVPFAVTDAEDLGDDFRPVLKTLEDFRSDIKDFLTVLQGLDSSTSMEGLGGVPTFRTETSSLRGLNPVTYQWADSRGSHHITVQVGPFEVARIKPPKGGLCFMCKKCMELADYQDDGRNAWVRITRQDPTDQEAGSFWNWNPFGGSITKTCRASYSYDKVGIARVN